MTEPILISSAIFQGREYLVKMNVMNKYLEMLVSDKQTGEEWQCSYDNSYIENLTHKTGNFKQFDIFIAMIKSGLLKTSDSIALELLTFEDLDLLRTKKIRGHSRHFSNTHGNNRRYLIVTYTVEFDRIHYPLPLEYCGPPDPTVLQSTIRKLETELARFRDENYVTCANVDSKQTVALQRRIDDLLAENLTLRNEICEMDQMLDGTPSRQVKILQRAIVNLEKCVLTERKSHHKLVEKLRNDKVKLVKELGKAQDNEKFLKRQLDQYLRNKSSRKSDRQSFSVNKSNQSLETLYRRQSPVIKSHSDASKNVRTRSVSPRLIKSEGWERSNCVPNLRFSKSTQQRSRSSSLSSSRNCAANDFFALETDVMDERPHRIDKRQFSKERRNARSRSSSVNSSNSSGSCEVPLEQRSTKTLRTKLRNSKKEFHTLEKRIHALQNVLKQNAKSKAF